MTHFPLFAFSKFESQRDWKSRGEGIGFASIASNDLKLLLPGYPLTQLEYAYLSRKCPYSNELLSNFSMKQKSFTQHSTFVSAHFLQASCNMNQSTQAGTLFILRKLW